MRPNLNSNLKSLHMGFVLAVQSGNYIKSRNIRSYGLCHVAQASSLTIHKHLEDVTREISLNTTDW